MAIIKSTKPISIQPRKNDIFSDIIGSLSPIAGSRDVQIIKNEEAIKTSIKNILLTDKTERFFNPTFGSDIKALLFENIDPASEITLKNFIITAIENYEPRANLLDVIVSPLIDENAYYVSITFSVINSQEPVQLEILLNRVR